MPVIPEKNSYLGKLTLLHTAPNLLLARFFAKFSGDEIGGKDTPVAVLSARAALAQIAKFCHFLPNKRNPLGTTK
jgi:hypothetical protein